MAKKSKQSSLSRIYEKIEAIKADDPAASENVKFSKAGARRMRVSLSEVSKLCKQARIELLEAMKKA